MLFGDIVSRYSLSLVGISSIYMSGSTRNLFERHFHLCTHLAGGKIFLSPQLAIAFIMNERWRLKTLMGLCHKIGFKNVDKNLQNYD